MKTLKSILLIVTPVFLLSCNSQPNRERATASDSERDVTTRDRDVSDNDTSTRRDIRIDAMTNENRGDVDDFIREVASGTKMEIQLGKYAQDNAASPRVKSFAAMMVRDHTKASEELRSIAQSKNITVPDALERDHNDLLSDLQEKSGEEFDREYMSKMVDDHQEDVDNFTKYAEDGEDPDLKSFAAKMLPKLLAHQDSAKSIRDDLR
jgi:putative membrane protein